MLKDQPKPKMNPCIISPRFWKRWRLVPSQDKILFVENTVMVNFNFFNWTTLHARKAEEHLQGMESQEKEA